MANSYSAPNFNIDTSTSIDTATIGLEAIKGGAVAAGDKIYVYNSAKLTVNKSIACLLISLGETSAGAATDGQRRGDLEIAANVTITFDGAATATNSGIKSNPASAPGTANESKSSTLSILGTAAQPTILTNNGTAYSATKRFCLNWAYGQFGTMGVWQINYTSSATSWAQVGVPISATYSVAASHNLGTVSYTSGNAGASLNRTVVGQAVAGTRTIPVIIEDIVIDESAEATATVGLWAYADGFSVGGSITGVAGAGIIIKRHKKIGPSGVTSRALATAIPIAAGTTWYTKNIDYETTDVRATLVVPADLTLTDAGTSGELTAAWSNAASYVAGDKLVVYNASGDAVLAILDATAGSGIVSGLTNGTAYTCYAKATSDNYVFSAACANAGAATPTLSKLPAWAKNPEDTAFYTESDPDGVISIDSATQITVTAMQRQSASRVARDFGAGYWAGDFAHRFKVNVGSAANNMTVYPWMLANALGANDALVAASETFLKMACVQAGGLLTINLKSFVTGAQESTDTSVTLTTSTDYYVEVYRCGLTVKADIYSDSGYTTLVDSLTIAVATATSFRYLYQVNGKGEAGQTAAVSLVISNLLTSIQKQLTTAEEALRNSVSAGFAGSKILTGYSAKVINTTYTGSATAEAHTANQVLKSASGNWNDDNLGVGSEGNVKKNVLYGLGKTGSLESTPAAPTTPTGLAITDLGTGKGGKATITNTGSFAVTDELVIAVPAVAATKTKQTIVVTARTAGAAGNSIQPEFLGVIPADEAGQALALTDTANAPSVQLATSAAVPATCTPDAHISMRALVAGVIGNDLTIEADVGEALTIEEVGRAILITFVDAKSTTYQTIVDLINNESLLLYATGGSSDQFMGWGGLQHLANGADGAVTSTTAQAASTLNGSTQVSATGGTGATATAEPSFHLEGGADEVIIGRGTMAEYALNSGIICPNVTMSVARTGDKAKAASGLTSASESAYSSAAASWTPTGKDISYADEALRNIDPTEPKVLAPTAYKHLNVAKVGTLPASVSPDQCALSVTISGTTAALALTNLPAAATSVKVYYRLAGELIWTLGATITMPTTTGSIAGLTKSKLYEFQALTLNGTQVGYPSNLERKWVADASKFKAILDRVEAEIEALAWTGWATSQVTIAWSPALVKDKAMPRLAVAPGNAPDAIVAQTNTSYSVAFPVRLYLMDRVSTRDAQMEALLAKREALRQLFMQRNVLSEIDGVFNVRVEPMPVVNDPDIDERLLITGVELAVEVEEAR